MKKNLILLLGPTGVGKTDLSINLALHLKCEIISSDSRQFYREMKIGTAVPDENLLEKVRHHFIRFLSVKDYYSASLYERDVIRILPELFSRSDCALLTGGSALYIDAVCNGIDDIPDVDPAVREKYIVRHKQEGIESLRLSLKLLDPEHYGKVDLRNPKRIIRALEICETTGRPYSVFLKKEKRERDFGIIKIGLERPKDELYERIERRVDIMLENGLEEEARRLFPCRDLNALNTVGYRELFEYFQGNISMEEAVRLIKRNTRRYAKRQMTWWSRDKEIGWFNPCKPEEITGFIEGRL